MKILGTIAKLTGKAAVLTAKGAWHGAVGASTVGCWGVHAASKGAGLALDFARSQSMNHVECPRGHVLATEGVYQCEACGYTYEGSIWLCQNRECSAPVTPYISCEVCGLSVRNPMRLQA